MTVEQQPIFIDAIRQLSPEVCLDYFLNRKPVGGPPLPKPSAEDVAIAQRVLNNEFTICGETYHLPADFSWQTNPSRDKEWQVSHHKFSYAVSLLQAYRCSKAEPYLRKWVALIDSWLDEMSSGFIVASDAQVEARRVERWVYSFLLLREVPCPRGIITPDFWQRFLSRIATETLYLCEHLSQSLNHRTLQLSSIFLVGVVFPEFRLHSYFVRVGRDKLTENLLNEFYPDGVHVELSTHYHQLSLKSFLAFVELAQAHKVRLNPELLSRLSKALDFYLYMQWPNGEIPLINDADDGDFRYLLKQGSARLNDPRWRWGATLGKEGQPPEQSSKQFEDAGYFVFSDGWGVDAVTAQQRQHVFYDCAQLGAGKHGHFDLFNFCYFANGKPLMIDPGRYTYDAVPGEEGINWRRAFKSTAYHNTVEIDGKDQTRYIPKPKPGKFKLGPAVQVADRSFKLGQQSDWVCAQAHSVEYTPVHQRFFLYMQRQYLFILDRIHISDGTPHSCVLRFHLSPEMQGEVSLQTQGQQISAIAPDLTLLSYHCPGMTAALEPGWASKKYGIKHPIPVVTLGQTDTQSLFFCTVVAPRPVNTSPAANFEIQSLDLLNEATDSMLLFQVSGQDQGQAFRDRFCFARDGQAGSFQGFGLTFEGQGVGFRQTAEGQVTYLLSQQAKHIAIDNRSLLTSQTAQSIEWHTAQKEFGK
ncbi:MAG: alginate lyase family protein [Leptolyngbya sp. SIO1E4]|nr:alginate lyase family protein [Leptolyngbya sp. SIO1E4]